MGRQLQKVARTPDVGILMQGEARYCSTIPKNKVYTSRRLDTGLSLYFIDHRNRLNL